MKAEQDYFQDSVFLEGLEKIAKETVAEIVKTEELVPTLLLESPEGFDVMGIVMESKEDILDTIKTLLRDKKSNIIRTGDRRVRHQICRSSKQSPR